jgi:FkbM family methyltransferase
MKNVYKNKNKDNIIIMETYYNNIIIKENITHVKLDIGLSYNAPHSHNWLETEPDLLVIGFEPNPDFLSSISSKDNINKRESCHGNPIDKKYVNERFFLFPVALSNVNEPTEMIFYETQKDVGCSSLYKPIDINLGEYKIKSNVPVYSLKHFFDLFPFDKFEYIDYIKIDAQGSDLDILQSADYYLREKVVYITAEPESNSYENCSHNNEQNIEKYLLSQNFIRVYNKNTCDPTYINKKFQHLENEIYIFQN